MSLNEGDHLWVSKTLYSHHGIYIGNNKVIHYSCLSNGLQSGVVCETSLFEFSGNCEVKKKVYKNKKYNQSEVVERVNSRIGEQLYNVHSNNCEHFCSWAITGEHKSNQIDIYETVIGFVTPVGEIGCNLYTVVKSISSGDAEIIKSSEKKISKTVAEKVAISGVIASTSVVTAPVVVVGGALYGAFKLFKKIRG